MLVVAVTGDGPVIADPAHRDAGCTDVASGVTFHPPPSVAWVVAANGSREFTLPNTLRMSNSSDTVCQGATFWVPVRLVGVSNA